jgi:DNA polymerase III delta subunit
MHPFVLYKKLEAARRYGETALVAALESVAAAEFARKSGGVSAEIQIETTVLRLGASGPRA